MIDAMVNDGDIVIMKSAQQANNGDMVAIWLPQKDETTLKYFYKEKDHYRLQPANPTMDPIFVNKTEPLEIKGKVVMVIRSMVTKVV
jgi:repressor LexA